MAQVSCEVCGEQNHKCSVRGRQHPRHSRNAKPWYAGYGRGRESCVLGASQEVFKRPSGCHAPNAEVRCSLPPSTHVPPRPSEDNQVDINNTMASENFEKTDVDYSETSKHESPSPVPRERLEYDNHSRKALIRKVDWRLLPILGALYSIALIDRVNISAARVAGMDKDLGLNIGDRYTVALVVFFPPYFLLELPSNIALRRVGAANWLALIAFSWGELTHLLQPSLLLYNLYQSKL
jgi:hypothetical protein